MEATFDALRELAVQHLPPDRAEQWISQLRPGIALEEGSEPGPVAGHLGGLPKLPDDMEWPVWKHGPLSLIASIDCAALPARAVDIPLPEDGTLLFFSFDHGAAGDTSETYVGVDIGDRETWNGARVIHVPAGIPAAERETPLGLEPHPRQPLSARATTTAPDPWHVCLRDVFAPGRPLNSRWSDYPEGFLEAGDELAEPNPPHRIGGHANACQSPVEEELAYHLLGEERSDDALLSQEARAWILLGHFYEYGRDGWLYWLIRPQDLAERRFDRAMFTFQC
ncbi:YwqG family protein [Streptomyces sp. NPDC047108]|uniref:YwqG family protein n=1 Tax=Streptomyces sp. NPDC047108 TaxID=3155025 RepID=UPI003408073D